MTDKVQKIKEWISKTQDSLMDAQGNFENPSDEEAFHILTNLDYYIDSLKEEPNAKFKVGQTITDPTDSTFIFHINKIENGRYIEKEDEWVLVKEADENYELVEEPVSEEFEKKFISFVDATHDNNGSYSLHDFAQRLYNIVKEELKEPISKDLEEAAKRYAQNVYPDEQATGLFGTGDYEPHIDRSPLRDSAIEDFMAGAKWQKEKDQNK